MLSYKSVCVYAIPFSIAECACGRKCLSNMPAPRHSGLSYLPPITHDTRPIPAKGQGLIAISMILKGTPIFSEENKPVSCESS